MSLMDYINHIFINIFSALIVLIVLTSLGRLLFKERRNSTPDMIFFTYMSLSIFALLLLEAVRWHAFYYPETTSRTIHTLSFILYYALQFAPPSLYLLYVDYHLHQSGKRLTFIAKIVIPVNILAALASATSPLTGLLFSIDDANRYSRGFGFSVYIAILFVMTFAGVLLILRGRNSCSKVTLLNLLTFPFVTFASGLLQILFYGLSITWPMSTTFVIVAAMNIQKIQIHTDHLTGLFNRRSFDNRLHTEVDRSLRYGSPLSLIMMDIDHFKDINDDYGHDIGDRVLVSVAEILRKNTRVTDTVARWGGEEFIILMTETDQARAAYAAEKLRKTIEEHTFYNGIKLTMSFGVAQWLQIASKNLWFRRADRALYQAKAAGRNRVEQCLWRSILSPEETKIRWQSRFETGDEEIDREHEELINLGSRLLLRPDSPKEVLKARKALEEHIVSHFAHEESLMDETRYPQKKQHTEIHNDIKQKAILAFEEAEKGFCDNFCFFLIDEIIIKHFYRSDKPFVSFMQNQKSG